MFIFCCFCPEGFFFWANLFQNIYEINLVQKFKILILSWNLVHGLFRKCKNSMVVFTFSVSDLSLQVFFQKICWHFDVNWLISQYFIRRDLKAMVFLVLPCKTVLHAFFFFYIKPLVTPLLIQLFCNKVFTFSVLLFC